eukprot:261572-Pelagomonas_calceolata.AAC.1
MDATMNHNTPTLLQLTGSDLTNLTDKLQTHMQDRHKLGSADTSGYYYSCWQRLYYTIWPLP